MKIGILVSGRGSNMEAIIKACQAKEIAAEVALVISDNPRAPALEKAGFYGIQTALVSKKKDPSKETFEKEMADLFDQKKVEWIVCAGFMRLLSPTFLSRFPNRILNIHPSLLPAFPGLNAQKQALDHGVRFSGTTVHFMDSGCDTGPILLQAVVPVLQGDTVETLSARILKEEHRLLPKSIDLIARNKVKINGRRVEILENP